MSAPGDKFAALLAAIGRTPDEHLFISYIRPGQSMVNIPTTVARAPEIVAGLSGHANVWFSVQPTTGEVKHGNSRATRETVASVVTLYADLDFKGNGVTRIQAASIIRELSARLGSDPAAVVASGGGCQPYWPIGTIEPGLGQLLLDAWKALVIGVAKLHGGQVDTGVFNLDRILRVPGPPNLKQDYLAEYPDGAPTGVSFPDGWELLDPSLAFERIQRATAELPVEVRHQEPIRTEHEARPNVGSGEGSPLDDFNTNADWDDPLLIGGAGWVLHSRDSSGTRNWTRPDKNPADGFSATTNRNGATGQDDRLYNFSSSVDLDIETPMSKAYVYAKLHHRGDMTAAKNALAARGYGAQRASDDWATPEKLAAMAARSRVAMLPEDATAEEVIAAAEADVADIEASSIYNWEYPGSNANVSDDPDGWKAVDLREVILTGRPRLKPSVLTRSDGNGLLYRGKVNSLIGHSETGKSWVAVMACKQAIEAGEIAIYIDFEDDENSVTGRLSDLGVSDEALIQRFLYIPPRGRLAGNPNMQSNLEGYLNLRPAIIVVDAWNEGMAEFEMSFMEHNDNNLFARSFLRQLALSGAAVLVLDHVPKDMAATTKGAIGPQVKRSVIDGCSIKANATRTPLIPGKRGTVRLTVDKDRPGGLRAAAGSDNEYVGTFVLEPDRDGLACQILTPTISAVTAAIPVGTSDEDRKTMRTIMEVVTLGDGEGFSQSALEKSGGRARAKTAEILNFMVDTGTLEREKRGQTLIYRRKLRAQMSMTEQQVLDAIMGGEKTPEEN